MVMPNGYKEVQVGGYTPVQVGGHKCIIREVQERTSSKGTPMLVVYFDFDAQDVQPNYFAKKFKEDQKTLGDKAKWRGIFYITLSGEYGVPNLKRFNTAVEHSNQGFQILWDQNPGDGRYVGCLKNRRVGFVFGKEEYRNSQGRIGTSIKPMRACDYNKAATEEAPATKKLKDEAANEGFMTVSPSFDDDTPFR